MTEQTIVSYSALDCSNITSPSDGSVSYSNGTAYRSVATFSCNTGYTISASTARTCKADKMWSNATPKHLLAI